MTDISKTEEEITKSGDELIQKFKDRLKDLVNEVLGEAYVDIMPYIANDSWLNYREFLRLNFENESAKNHVTASWGQNLRRLILKENMDEIVRLLNQDLVERVKDLEKMQLDRYRNMF